MGPIVADLLFPCPDCRGSGNGPGLSSKASGVWERPECARCAGLGSLFVTLSGDAEHVYLNDESGAIVATFGSRVEALAACSDFGGRP